MPVFKLTAIAETVALDEDPEPRSELSGVLEDIDEKRRRILNYQFMKFEQEKGRILFTKGLDVAHYILDDAFYPGYAGTYLN